MRKKLGNEGKKMLYTVGKRFGYRFSIMGNFSKRGEMPDSKVPEYIGMINKFIEGTYATDISCEVDMKIPKVEYSLKNFIVCSKIENGYFLPLGAASGLMAYILNNNDIEGVHLECQGSGKERCKLLYEPYDKLKSDVKTPVFRQPDLSGLEFDSAYETMNTARPVENSTRSFQQFIDSGVFSFKLGVIMNGDERFFIYEVSGIYMPEVELQKKAETKKILFDSAYETGKSIAKDYGAGLSVQSIMDLLIAFGWGDVAIFEKGSKYTVTINYFPWTKFWETVEFVAFHALLAGMLSVLAKRKVMFKTVEKDISQGYLSLAFLE